MAKKQTAPTLGSLARALGVSPQAVDKWTRVWPFGKSGPFDLEAVRRWRAETLAPPSTERGGVSDSRLSQATLLVRVRQAERLNLLNEIMRGEWIRRGDAQRDAAGAMQKFRAALVSLPDTISELLDTQGLLAPAPGSRESVDSIIARHLNEALNRLAADLSDACNRDDIPPKAEAAPPGPGPPRGGAPARTLRPKARR